MARDEETRTDAQGADLVDTRGAARYLNGLISEKTLEAWRHRQQPGPRYLKLGRRVVYRIADLRAYIERQARGAAA